MNTHSVIDDDLQIMWISERTQLSCHKTSRYGNETGDGDTYYGPEEVMRVSSNIRKQTGNGQVDHWINKSIHC